MKLLTQEHKDKVIHKKIHEVLSLSIMLTYTNKREFFHYYENRIQDYSIKVLQGLGMMVLFLSLV